MDGAAVMAKMDPLPPPIMASLQASANPPAVKKKKRRVMLSSVAPIPAVSASRLASMPLLHFPAPRRAADLHRPGAPIPSQPTKAHDVGMAARVRLSQSCDIQLRLTKADTATVHTAEREKEPPPNPRHPLQPPPGPQTALLLPALRLCGSNVAASSRGRCRCQSSAGCSRRRWETVRPTCC